MRTIKTLTIVMLLIMITATASCSEKDIAADYEAIKLELENESESETKEPSEEAEQKWTIYAEASDGMLHKIRLQGLQQKLISSNDQTVQIENGEIYYLERESLYRSGFDGKNLTKLSNAVILSFKIYDGWIYYTDISNAEYQIYKMKLDGSATQRISKDECMLISIVDSYIYYYQVVNSRYGIGMLCRMRIDGTGGMRLCEDIIEMSPLSVHIEKGWCYYCSFSDDRKLYKVKVNGMQRKNISEDSVAHFKVFDGAIYYKKAFDTILVKVEAEGNQQETMLEEGIVDFYVMGDQLYYISNYDARDLDSSYKLYKTGLGGKKKMKLCDDSMTSFIVAGEWICFLGVDDNKIYKIKMDGTAREEISPHSQ